MAKQAEAEPRTQGQDHPAEGEFTQRPKLVDAAALMATQPMTRVALPQTLTEIGVERRTRPSSFPLPMELMNLLNKTLTPTGGREEGTNVNAPTTATMDLRTLAPGTAKISSRDNDDPRDFFCAGAALSLFFGFGYRWAGGPLKP